MRFRSRSCFPMILLQKSVNVFVIYLLYIYYVIQDFLPRLKDHLLGRLLNKSYDGDEHMFSDADRNTVRIVDNRIYSAKVLRVNYTTYDIRRNQDSMNPRTHCDGHIT